MINSHFPFISVLEVYQFARDVAVSEALLLAQEPYLLSRNYGRNLEEVVSLIKKYEGFEKSAQEERFMALGKLTNFELKEMQTKGFLKKKGFKINLLLERRSEEEERFRRAGRAGCTPSKSRPCETVFLASPNGTTSRSHEGIEAI